MRYLHESFVGLVLFGEVVCPWWAFKAANPQLESLAIRLDR